jgi:hypothetical protein
MPPGEEGSAKSKVTVHGTGIHKEDMLSLQSISSKHNRKPQE